MLMGPSAAQGTSRGPCSAPRYRQENTKTKAVQSRAEKPTPKWAQRSHLHRNWDHPWTCCWVHSQLSVPSQAPKDPASQDPEVDGPGRTVVGPRFVGVMGAPPKTPSREETRHNTVLVLDIAPANEYLEQPAYVRHRSTAPPLRLYESDLASVSVGSLQYRPVHPSTERRQRLLSSATPWMPSYYPACSPLLPGFLSSRTLVFAFSSISET